MNAFLVNIFPLLILVVIFYFMLIKPQKKQQSEHQNMLNNLKVGDYVVTVGGMKGVVTKVKDNDIRLRVATGVEIDFVKSAIGRVEVREEAEEK